MNIAAQTYMEQVKRYQELFTEEVAAWQIAMNKGETTKAESHFFKANLYRSHLETVFGVQAGA